MGNCLPFARRANDNEEHHVLPQSVQPVAMEEASTIRSLELFTHKCFAVTNSRRSQASRPPPPSYRTVASRPGSAQTNALQSSASRREAQAEQVCFL